MAESAEEQRRRIAAAHRAAQGLPPIARTIPTREGRKGDKQPMPVGNDLPIIHHLVQQDLEARLTIGVERYGQPLQPHNGRNALQDAYEEVLDLAVYLRQAIYEQEHPK